MDMKPLLPGAIELPNDKYRIRIDELEAEVKETKEKYKDEREELSGEIIALRRENEELLHRIQKMERMIAETQS